LIAVTRSSRSHLLRWKWKTFCTPLPSIPLTQGPKAADIRMRTAAIITENLDALRNGRWLQSLVPLDAVRRVNGMALVRRVPELTLPDVSVTREEEMVASRGAIFARGACVLPKTRMLSPQHRFCWIVPHLHFLRKR